MLFLCHSLVHVDKISLFPNFQSDSKVSFVMYVCFTASYCHYVGNYYVDIINRQFGLFTKQMNLQELFHTNIMYLKADVKVTTFSEKKWRRGDKTVDHKNGPLVLFSFMVRQTNTQIYVTQCH